MTYTPGTAECTVYYDCMEIINGIVYYDSVEQTITNIQGANAGIGLSLAVFKDAMSVWLEINYRP